MSIPRPFIHITHPQPWHSPAVGRFCSTGVSFHILGVPVERQVGYLLPPTAGVLLSSYLVPTTLHRPTPGPPSPPPPGAHPVSTLDPRGARFCWRSRSTKIWFSAAQLLEFHQRGSCWLFVLSLGCRGEVQAEIWSKNGAQAHSEWGELWQLWSDSLRG